LAVFTEVAQAFADVLAAQERSRVIDQQVDLAEKVVQAVEQRVQAGKDSPLEATKARVSLTQAHIEQKRVLRQLPAVRQLLAATWGAREALFTNARGALDRVIHPPELSVLQALIVQHPAVARWDVEIEQRQARIALEKANALPDPTLAGGYRRLGEVDESAFVVGLSLPLPVANRNQGNILAAKATLAQTYRQRTAALTGIRTDLSRAYASLSSAYMAANDLQQTVMPGAQEAFDSAQTGYQNGKFDYLTVLDAQRTLFTARMQYYDAVADYHKAKAKVEQLIGQSLESLGGQSHD
jgi:cobalt-zinc-cadmium efflux system outer membrane protein